MLLFNSHVVKTYEISSLLKKWTASFESVRKTLDVLFKGFSCLWSAGTLINLPKLLSTVAKKSVRKDSTVLGVQTHAYVRMEGNAVTLMEPVRVRMVGR